MFYVGQKVVCVDDQQPGKYLPPGRADYLSDAPEPMRIKKGEVYTVSALSIECETECCLLQEIYGEHYYACARFRPVIERKTDISILTAMLKDAEQKLPAHG